MVNLAGFSEKIKTEVKKLPDLPGVYLFYDQEKTVLYIGKAKNLRKRVSSYFYKKQSELKTAQMLSHVSSFAVFLVDLEAEALLLERSLIKKYSPKYNILLRDDKEFPLIRVDLSEPWPRIRKVRRKGDDKALYLGPFSQPLQLNMLLDTVFQVFPLVRCTEQQFRTVKRPCIYYDMKQCLGPCCLQSVNRQDYLEVVKDAISFLKGKRHSVLLQLKKRMKQAAQEENFEKAASIRDQMQALERTEGSQKVAALKIKEADILAAYKLQGMICLQILELRDHNLIGQKSFITSLALQSEREALESFLLYYYEENKAPSTLVFPAVLEDSSLWQQDSIRMPKKKILAEEKKVHELYLMALRNATYHLETNLAEKESAAFLLDDLQKKLSLAKSPKIIECLDISHFQGTATVAAFSCFVKAAPAKELYRLYNLEDEAKSPDDYQSLRQAMNRRLKRAELQKDLPDLFVIDGGKGQLSAVMEVARQFKDLDCSFVALAKKRSFSKGDIISYSDERVFFPGSQKALHLISGEASFQILTSIRDEAHRLAISHHRNRRTKLRQKFILEEVSGLGPQLAKRLYHKFGGLQGLKEASLEELLAVKGVGQALAHKIKEKISEIK